MDGSTVHIDLVEFLLEKAVTPKQRTLAPLYASGLVEWLLAHFFPSRVRKSPLLVLVTSPGRGQIQVCTENGSIDGPGWEKAAHSSLKKVVVEDLGDMNAKELKNSIPEEDAEGRGKSDLLSYQKKFSVQVVFDAESGHVLLVGDAKKLEKKVFVIRNMLSHYHWRLSGTDVSFDKKTSS
mmetsp:Transcript_2731/g.4114  ORF Transcript_2731/g.4114 Transcript_2731/m.4114 type:complete len:180 (+) Transcript_2731:121-660(+)|eukprot:CAMPEP_0197251250 /NCGR_PEP_ID=MMETSP1429-20130617/56524_1 /TAXON_ID=49237 /ORGANISM="Chaetoceros  sp., Strain UNC1202" /LENGTH=179 /DNA_ID=CAMNT_0042713281 /DNA_START=40 /DNA_END=582 /DNA_ORIENTATION=+